MGSVLPSILMPASFETLLRQFADEFEFLIVGWRTKDAKPIWSRIPFSHEWQNEEILCDKGFVNPTEIIEIQIPGPREAGLIAYDYDRIRQIIGETSGLATVTLQDGSISIRSTASECEGYDSTSG